MTRLLKAMNDHDNNVQCPETLRVLREGLTSTSLLDNWRKMLSKSELAKDILPWFLDGTLDA